MDAETVERLVSEKGLNAPRVSLSGLHAKIKDVEIVKHVSASGQVLRWAVLTMENGFAVTGAPSCAVSCANDNAEIGEAIAIKNAEGEVWALEGYALKQKLHEAS